jgi:hypothetical protein
MIACAPVAHTEDHELVRVTIGVKEEADRIVVKHLITSTMPMSELELCRVANRSTDKQIFGPSGPKDGETNLSR